MIAQPNKGPLTGLHQRLLVVLVVVLVSACASTAPVPDIDQPDWTVEFERPIEFQLLVTEELLVVGTLRHLYGIDPTNGDTLWRMRNVAVGSQDLTPLPGRPYLLVNDSAGGAFHDRDTNILALHLATGKTVWESAMLQGKILQGAVDESSDVFYFSSVVKAHGDDRGFLSGLFRKGLGSGYEQNPQLNALDVSTGELIWSHTFEQPVVLRPSYSPQLDDKDDWSHTRPFDLGAYHPPVIADGLLCLTYTGIHCFDVASGSSRWQRKMDVLENDLGLAYANPIVADSVIISSGDNRVQAFDLQSGKRLWRSERLDIISELILDENIVYAQLGGQFFDLDSDKWRWKGDFGIIALDRANGNTLWKYEKADGAVTNLLVNADLVWLADESELYALDRYNGDLKFRRRHGFEDAPIFTALNEVGQVVLVGEGEAAAFDLAGSEAVWHVHHPVIGPGAWSRFGSALLHASGNVLKFGSFVLSHGVGLLPSLAIPIGSIDFKIINTKKIVSTRMARSGRRMTYQAGSTDMGIGNANLSGNFQYFVTQPKGFETPVMAVVNLSTGTTERFIALDAEKPNVVINEGYNNLYQAFDRQLVAMPLEQRTDAFRTASRQGKVNAVKLVAESPDED